MRSNWSFFGEKNFLNSDKNFFNVLEKFCEKRKINLLDSLWSEDPWSEKNEKTKEKREGEISKLKTEFESEKHEIELKEIEKTSFKWLEQDLKDNINLKSFHKIFKKLCIENNKWSKWVLKEISKFKPSEEKNQEKIRNSISPWSNSRNSKSEDEKSYSDIRSLFEDNWYITESFFERESEWEAIFQLVEAFVENKEILNLGKKWEKILNKETWIINNFEKFENYLFDFDYDSDIERTMIEWSSESEIKDMTNEKNYPHLIENLWLLKKWENISDFNKRLFKDPDLKNQFHERLVLTLWSLHNAWPLFIKDWDTKFLAKYLKLEDDFRSKIEKIAEENLSNEKIADNLHWLKEKLTDEDWNKLCDQVRFQWAWFSLWLAKWAGLNFDISNLMNWWLDSLQVWVVKLPDWKIVPWIWVSKNLLQANITENTEISSTTWINTAWFFINLSVAYTNTEEVESIFQSEKNWSFVENMKVSWNINYINIWWVAWVTSFWLNLSEMDEESFAWSEKMVQQMYPIMDRLLEECKKWTDLNSIYPYDIIWWNKEWWNEELSEEQTDQIREKYQEIKDLYDSLTNTENVNDKEKDRILNKIKRSSIQQYSNTLHLNNKWLNFTWFWAWIAFVAWIMPIPYIMATWEYNYSDIREVKDVLADQAINQIKYAEENKKELWSV